MANDGIYDYASEDIEIPAASHDKLANITLSRFRDAVRWQSAELVGGKTLRHVMRECYDQYNGLLSPADREIADAIGVDAMVNLTAMKSGLVQSYLLETLVQANQIPWTISPTPVPDLSETMMDEATQELLATVNSGMFQGDVTKLAYEIKRSYINKQFESAQDAADAMERLITDQCMEGGWNRAMYGFTSDFTVYPFAVLQGPVPTRRSRLVWSGDSLKSKTEVFYEFKSISPWDFWYSPDSPDTQRGTGVFVRQRWTRKQLLDAMLMPSYIDKNIEEVLREAQRKDFIFRWLSENPEQPDGNFLGWAHGTETIDVLTHYGYFRGSELKAYGVTGIDDSEYYNATVTIAGRRTIQAFVSPNPAISTRPIFTSSFYKTQDRIPSFSIPQRIRDVERCYLIMLRYLVSNAAGASGPIIEADYQRLAKYMSDDDIAKIIPNTVYLASNDVPNSAPALKFYAIPSVMPQYQALLSYFMDLTDRVSNIPAGLHGTAVGSGANRTFRGAAMLQGNAVKAIQAAVANIDQFVFEPMGELLYNYNMVYSKDDSVKGDCKILARGATGLLQREIDRQNSYEVLQLVGSAGQQIAQMPKGAQIITWALTKCLGSMGVPKDLLDTAPQGSPQEQPMGQAQGQPNLSSGDALAQNNAVPAQEGVAQ